MVPAVVVTRTHLMDGHSDDLLALLGERELLPGTKIIVLAAADCTSKKEARQLALGADCVLRDPLRTEVLQEYIDKFLRPPAAGVAKAIEPRSFQLGGAMVHPERQLIQYGARSVHLSPKEVELAQLLAESAGKILTYDMLYSELFGRVFSGESANLRVLFGKLSGSCRKLGFDLRAMVRVMPKAGYACLARVPVPEARTGKRKSRDRSRGFESVGV